MDEQRFKTMMYDLLRELGVRVRALMARCCEPHGVTCMQARVLLELAMREGRTVGELGRALGMSSGNISAMCKALERGGHLERRRARTDERVVEVWLTPRGREAVASIDSAFDDAFCSRLAGWDDARRAQVYESFCTLNRLLGGPPAPDGDGAPAGDAEQRG